LSEGVSQIVIAQRALINSRKSFLTKPNDPEDVVLRSILKFHSDGRFGSWHLMGKWISLPDAR